MAAPNTHVRVGGVWKKMNKIHVNVGGVWKPLKNLYTRQGGVWKKTFTGFVPSFPVIQGFTTTTTAATSTTHVANLPAGIVAGEILMVICNVGSFPGIAASGWTVGGDLSVKWIWKVATGSEGSTVTITGMTTAQKVCSVSLRIGLQSGNTPETPNNIVNGGETSGLSTNPNPPNLNIAFGNTKALLLVCGNWNINGTPLTPSGFPAGYTQLTNVVTTGSGTNQRMYVLWRTAQVAAEDAGAFTAASSAFYTGCCAIQGAP